MGGIFLLLMIPILLLNVGISFWNARVCGLVWDESKVLGDWIRVVVISGAVQAACGFTMAIAFALVAVLAGAGALTPRDLEFVVPLLYLAVGIPLIGTGLIILMHSWIEFFRNKTLVNAGVAVYNTIAMAHNISDAVNGFGPALKEVFKTIGGAADGDDNDAKAVVMGIVILLVALGGGYLLTMAIIKHYAGKLPLPERQSVPQSG